MQSTGKYGNIQLNDQKKINKDIGTCLKDMRVSKRIVTINEKIVIIDRN